MKIIEVPVFNEDGSVKITHLLNPEQVQVLLQFALQFLVAAGLATSMAVTKPTITVAVPPADTVQ